MNENLEFAEIMQFLDPENAKKNWVSGSRNPENEPKHILDPEIVEMLQFLDPETSKMPLFLDQEIVKMDNFWTKK